MELESLMDELSLKLLKNEGEGEQYVFLCIFQLIVSETRFFE